MAAISKGPVKLTNREMLNFIKIKEKQEKEARQKALYGK